jgi:protein-S-isoprenylcysteine O-methyltransferase Ste14
MPIASAMADESPTEELRDPVAREAIGAKDTAPDPGMIKLKRTPSKISVITAAGVVFLCALFLVRLHGDRTFGGNETPQQVAVSEIAAGNVATNSYVTFTGEPMMAHAIRTSIQKTGIGLRVVPMRGTTDRVWIVIHGDGWEPAVTKGYTGRLRKLEDMPFYDAVSSFASGNPRPLFATIAEVRKAFATNEVLTVSGDRVKLADGDKVAYDVVDPSSALVIAAVNERFASVQAWTDALTAAGLTVGKPLADASPAGADGKPTQVRFEITMPDAVTAVTAKLEAAGLWAARVEPITRHQETQWSALRTGGAMANAETTIGLMGFYVAKGIPDGALALITSENPKDYWYVWPITIALGLLLLMFAWALVRAVKRDILSPAARPS